MGLSTTDHHVSAPPVLLSLCTELCTQMCACQESQPHGPQASSQTCHSISGAPSARPTPSCPGGGGETGLEKEPQAWSCRTLEGAPSPTTTHARITLQASQNTRPACPSWRGTRILGVGASDQAVPGTGQPCQTQSVISMPSKTYPQCHRDKRTQEGCASLRSQRQEEGASRAHSQFHRELGLG